MALAEARALGIPILAKIGGNSPIHVDAGAGGELVSSDSALAQAYLTLVRDPATLRARAVQARAHAPRARTWQHAASELMAQLATYEK
jgi:glycosyltransferase involved in cell wall biosynthesis